MKIRCSICGKEPLPGSYDIDKNILYCPNCGRHNIIQADLSGGEKSKGDYIAALIIALLCLSLVCVAVFVPKNKSAQQGDAPVPASPAR